MAKKKKPENLKQFLSSPDNAFLASVSLAISIYLIWDSAKGLYNKTYYLYCGPHDLRPYPYTFSVEEAHANYRAILWLAGGLLGLSAYFLIYRSKLAKRLLITTLIIFGIGGFLYMIGQGLNGIGCLNW